MTPTSDELLPCPFCGEFEAGAAYCSNCGARVVTSDGKEG